MLYKRYMLQWISLSELLQSESGRFIKFSRKVADIFYKVEYKILIFYNIGGY